MVTVTKILNLLQNVYCMYYRTHQLYYLTKIHGALPPYKISYCNIAGFVAIWDLQSYCLYEKSDDPPERKL